MATRTAQDVRRMIEGCDKEIARWQRTKNEWVKELVEIQAGCAHPNVMQVGRAAGTFRIGKGYCFRCPDCLKTWTD